MTSIGETKTVVLVLLCLLFATATSCTESDELSPFESDGADMGANSAKAGVAWASLDKDVRDEFSNEFHHRRDRRALYDEYVEIINLGNLPASLDGWTLSDIDDGTPVFVFTTGFVAPGGVIRVYTNQIHPEWGGYSFGRGTAIWNNGDPDIAGLADPDGVVVSTKTYPPGCD